MPTRPTTAPPAPLASVAPRSAGDVATGPVVRPLDDGLAAGYLRRLGVGAAPPSADELARLHRAHVERVPYETFWIHLREGWGTDPVESARRLATEARGGYCYQLNGAFSALLATLGYRVTRHVAGVHDPAGPSTGSLANHVALLAHGLPTDANPGGTWYLDAGLGDAVHEPMPLLATTDRQGPFGLTLAPADTVAPSPAPAGEGPVGDWHLATDGGSSVPGVSLVTSRAVGMDAFADRHVFNATSPQSGFAALATAQRRHATGCDILRGCVLTSRTGVGESGVATTTLESREAWLGALGDVFGLVLDVAEDDVDDLWSRTVESHESWLATKAAA